MKYYLVAVFDNNTYPNLEIMQKNVCHRYKIYKNLPILHIMLEIIDDPKLDELDNIINNIIKPYKKFKVYSSGDICFDTSFKSISLKVENKGYIVRLFRKINEKLIWSGFKVKDKNDLYVSLANTNYPIKELSSKEHISVCSEARSRGFNGEGKIDRIELWKSITNKKDMVVRSYELREY
ncbi:MAG: 2'-5' RNA ligase family protein [Bacillota bacterium]|nr:2'-5' RNA ligase family protein [Bacillota bacterium]